MIKSFQKIATKIKKEVRVGGLVCYDWDVRDFDFKNGLCSGMPWCGSKAERRGKLERLSDRLVGKSSWAGDWNEFLEENESSMNGKRSMLCLEDLSR